jgi:hypothetical protein
MDMTEEEWNRMRAESAIDDFGPYIPRDRSKDKEVTEVSYAELFYCAIILTVYRSI